ncbi:hypothetical protein DFH01_01845 [Falsiroseomonas bella]|uniref:Uncharacterized protein n=1 Tax=Falsiroseomonas bella TaxID=2184016 RepID=A0A317FI70_9PROT|nr:hypothetical protein [Falsiroseomonas bella]PWS38072.1 hypothetical protein DFH01_01845 [Falsiroseomonas bella]
MPAAVSDRLDGDLAALLDRITAGDAARAVLAGTAHVTEAMDRLEAEGFLLEAAQLAAHALPRREAVWWACMCARHTAPAGAEELAALRDAAETWVRRQTDSARHAAFELAQAQGLDSPEAWAAMGAFWAGDSIAPPAVPKVSPAPHLTGTAVAGAINLAAVRDDPLRRDARLARFLDSARDIAAGGAGRLPPEG